MRPPLLTDTARPEPARRALDDVFLDLGIEPTWACRREGAFEWTAFRLRQEFRAHTPATAQGLRITTVTSTIPVVEKVDADETTVCRTLGALNRLSVGEALVWEAPRRRVVSHTGVALHDDNRDERIRELGAFSILGLAFAELGADVLAQLLDGRVASWRHPRAGFREEPSKALHVKDDHFVPCGEGASSFADAEEFERIARELEDGPLYCEGGDESGIAVEVAFGTDDTALVHATTAYRHPYLGSGLYLTTKVRAPDPMRGSCLQLASYLNLLEYRGDLRCSTQGAWAVEDPNGHEVVSHVCFYPNALHRPGLARYAVGCGIRRARWVGEVLKPLESLSPRRAADIVADRVRGMGAAGA